MKGEKLTLKELHIEQGQTIMVHNASKDTKQIGSSK